MTMKHLDGHDDQKKAILHDVFLLVAPPLLILGILVGILWLFVWVDISVAPLLISSIESFLARFL